MPSFNIISYTNFNNILAAAKNIDPTGTKTSLMTPVQVNYFICWADNLINAKLSPICYVPLIQITRNGVTAFPDPIEFIATQLASGYMIESIYAKVEPEISESGKIHKENALKYLEDLAGGAMIGSIRLDGQTLKCRNSFTNPATVPLDAPNKGNF